jgi:hypothetical protein
MNEKQLKTIEHTLSHANSDWRLDTIRKNLESGFNVSASLIRLSSYAVSNAIVAWYVESNLSRFRAWCRTAATSKKRAYQLGAEAFPAYSMYLELKWALLSNDAKLVADFMDVINRSMSEKKKNDVKSDEHFVSTAIHAWRAEWDIVEKKCHEITKAHELSGKKNRHNHDYNFFSGLATRDACKMEGALLQMLESKELRKNENMESGYNVNLFSSKALICSKIAWFHEVMVKVESELLPLDLLSWEKQEEILLVDFLAEFEAAR